MAEKSTLADAMELAQQLFSNATSERNACALADSLRNCREAGLRAALHYFKLLSSCDHERIKIISDMLQKMNRDGVSMLAALPVFVPLINSPEQHLRHVVTEILCNAGQDAVFAENAALGCLRNTDPDVRTCGAKILCRIAPWCGKALKKRLTDLLPTAKTDSATEDLLLLAIQQCREDTGGATSVSTVSRTRKPPADAAPFLLPDLSGKRVFFADDDKQIRVFMGRLLKGTGAELQLASNGTEAIQMLNLLAEQQQPLDLAILDLRMPGENGMKVLDHLRQLFTSEKTPVIILTAVSDSNLIATAMQRYSIQSYLVKPVQIRQFYECITMAVGAPQKAR